MLFNLLSGERIQRHSGSDKTLDRVMKKKRERSQVNKIRNEKEVTTHVIEIERIIRDCYEQLYTNKMDNLEEMDEFLET